MKIDTDADRIDWLRELEPSAIQLIGRHISSVREWFPRRFVPWGQGRDFDGPLAGEPWSPEQSALPQAARSALVVNLLTEDNLPGYHLTIGSATAGRPPGVAVVLVGGNDAMALLPLGAAARRFALALGRLTDAGWRLVVVPCPDPHDAPGFRVLPRLLASPRSRRLRRRQIRAAERVGALVAPSSTAPFLERAEELLSADGVHPSAAGYADYVERMFPVLLAAARRCGTLPERAALGS